MPQIVEQPVLIGERGFERPVAVGSGDAFPVPPVVPPDPEPAEEPFRRRPAHGQVGVLAQEGIGLVPGEPFGQQCVVVDAGDLTADQWPDVSGELDLFARPAPLPQFGDPFGGEQSRSVSTGHALLVLAARVVRNASP